METIISPNPVFPSLLRVPNGEGNFKLTYLLQFLSVEAKIADLGFSAKWFFFLYFFLQNFHFGKSYGDLIFYVCELRCETRCSCSVQRCFNIICCELIFERCPRWLRSRTRSWSYLPFPLDSTALCSLCECRQSTYNSSQNNNVICCMGSNWWPHQVRITRDPSSPAERTKHSVDSNQSSKWKTFH